MLQQHHHMQLNNTAGGGLAEEKTTMYRIALSVEEAATGSSENKDSVERPTWQ